jgi:NAD(P)H-dependent FMN reductase
MKKLMIIVGSVRPGRIGLPVAHWVRSVVDADDRFDVDFVDLKELALPFMDEPNHPAKHDYTKPHTIAWSERVGAADVFIFVSPEYNHGYSPALKNAVDFLAQEWWRKPVGFVSYGGVSAGSRGVAAFEPVLTTIGLVKTSANVEIPFVANNIHDGVFEPEEKFAAILGHQLTQLDELSTALGAVR